MNTSGILLGAYSECNLVPKYDPSPEWDEDVMESDKEATLQLYNLKVPLYVLPVPSILPPLQILMHDN